MSKKAIDWSQPMPSFIGQHRLEAGEVGIEIEVEGRRLPTVRSRIWDTHADGSLRGESAEYVLKKPVPRDQVKDALDKLIKAFVDNETEVNESYRTSVHIHLNAQDMAMSEVFNQMVLYMIFESLLVEYAGAGREGNLFCLRTQDAEYLVSRIRDGIQKDRLDFLGGEDLRYSSMNVTSLFKYGSLEFRALRGTTDPELIQTWVSLLLAVKDAARRYKNPVEILEEFSQKGSERFLQDTFPGGIHRVFDGYKNLNERLFSGARLAQDVAYATNWTAVKTTPKMTKEKEAEQERRLEAEARMVREMERAVRPADGRIRVPNPPGWRQAAQRQAFIQPADDHNAPVVGRDWAIIDDIMDVEP